MRREPSDARLLVLRGGKPLPLEASPIVQLRHAMSENAALREAMADQVKRTKVAEEHVGRMTRSLPAFVIAALAIGAGVGLLLADVFVGAGAALFLLGSLLAIRAGSGLERTSVPRSTP
jgi:hypothetical protein